MRKGLLRMTNSLYNKSKEPEEEIVIPEKKELSDPSIIPILFHEKKQEILYLLREKEMNIMELKQKTKLNPGTIKRHLDDLIAKGLVFPSRKVKNKYGIVLKYYRATAKSFIFNIKWP